MKPESGQLLIHLAVPGQILEAKWKGQRVSDEIYGEKENEEVKVWPVIVSIFYPFYL